MEKCPKCGESTLKEVPSVGSKFLGKSMKCTNSNCTYCVSQNTAGESLASLMNKNKKKIDEEE